MKIILKNMQKVEHAVELSGPAETVSALCQKAESVFGVDHGAVTLVHLGTVLGDQAKTLSEAGIADGALVIVVLKKGKVVRTAHSHPLFSNPYPVSMSRINPIQHQILHPHLSKSSLHHKLQLLHLQIKFLQKCSQ
jgi:hypothetical protein